MSAWILSGTVGVTDELPRRLTVGPRAAQFATVQEAVDAAGPGDTVVIDGGVYREHVVSRRGGEPGRPITICAASNQVVLLMAGAALEGVPEPVDGFPNIYRWPAAGLRESIASDTAGFWEAPTHLRLKRVHGLDECESRLGSWYYDAAGDALYLRSSGVAPARDLMYIRENAGHPVFEIGHPHMTLENLGFAFGKHGVLVVPRMHHVTLRNCRAFCNRSAGIHASGDHHRIEGNELFYNNQFGIQLRYGVNHARVLNNLAYHNGPNNGENSDPSPPCDLSLYSQGAYNLFEGNTVDGLHQNAFRIKDGWGSNAANVFRHNVVRGFFDCGYSGPSIEHNTIIVNGLGPRPGLYVNRVTPDPNPDPEAGDPGGQRRRTNIIFPAMHKEVPRFVDPAWRDFRLQEGSPYAGMGAYPDRGGVVFVDAVHGDDSHHGRSADEAFKTLAQALAVLHPGYTVYLLPGEYPGALRLIFGGFSASEPIRFRAHGRSEQVVLTGGVTIEQVDKDSVARTGRAVLATLPPAHIVLEGLTIRRGAVRIRNASNVRLSYCVLDEQETAVEIDQCDGVRLDHVTVAGAQTGVLITESAGTTISRSLFAGDGTAIACDTNSASSLQAYYNVYARAAWRLGERELERLADWCAAVAGASGGRVAPVALQGAYALPAESPLTFAADDFTFAGARPAPAANRLEIANLRTAGLAPSAVTLLWESPRAVTEATVRVRSLDDHRERTLAPASTFQIWGKYFDMSFRTAAFFAVERYLALDDLAPGRKYEATVTASSVDGVLQTSQTIRFATPEAYAAPRTYYVSETGDDNAEGTRPEQAWRTFKRAAGAVGPGDRVRVQPGVYGEILRPRIGGTAERPIVFESHVPRGAVIDLMQNLPVGIEMLNVNHVHVRGFAISNANDQTITLAQGRGLRISSCHVRYPRQSSFDKLRIGHTGLVAADAPDLRIENNVFLCAAWGIGLGGCPGAQVLNNTILGEGNYGIAIVPDSPDADYTIRNNLFYRAVMGYKTGCVLWMFNHRARLDSDYNLFYIPEDHKGMIGMIVDDRVRYKSLADWQAATGLDMHSVEGRPEFVNPAQGDFRLKENSLGRTAAEDGGPVGIRGD